MHGLKKTQQAQKSSTLIYDSELLDFNSLPKADLEINFLEKGIPLYKIFSLENILCKSNSDARRLIQQGGAKLNGKKIDDYNYFVTKKDIQNNMLLYISAGTKRHAIIKII